MALENVLADIPGLAGYLAQKQFDQRQQMGSVQSAMSVLNALTAQSGVAEQAKYREMQGQLMQAQIRQKDAELAQENQLRELFMKYVQGGAVPGMPGAQAGPPQPAGMAPSSMPPQMNESGAPSTLAMPQAGPMPPGMAPGMGVPGGAPTMHPLAALAAMSKRPELARIVQETSNPKADWKEFGGRKILMYENGNRVPGVDPMPITSTEHQLEMAAQGRTTEARLARTQALAEANAADAYGITVPGGAAPGAAPVPAPTPVAAPPVAAPPVPAPPGGLPNVDPAVQAGRNAKQEQILLTERAKEAAAGNAQNVAMIDNELAILRGQQRRGGDPSRAGTATLTSAAQVGPEFANVTAGAPAPVAVTGGGQLSPRQLREVRLEAEKQGLNAAYDSIKKGYDVLSNAPAQIAMVNTSRALLPQAGPFVGPFGETKANIVSFFNNNFGTTILPDQIASQGALRTALFNQIMDNLKKLDASPAKEQQRIMQDALGNLNTDPGAMNKIFDIIDDSVRIKVNEHNRRIKPSFPHGDIFKIDLPPKEKASTLRAGEVEGKVRTGGIQFISREPIRE